MKRPYFDKLERDIMRYDIGISSSGLHLEFAMLKLLRSIERSFLPKKQKQ